MDSSTVSMPIASTPSRPTKSPSTPKIDKCLVMIEDCINGSGAAIDEIWIAIKKLQEKERQHTLELNLMKSDNVTLRSENGEMKKVITKLTNELSALKSSQITTNPNALPADKVIPTAPDPSILSHPPPNHFGMGGNEKEMTKATVLELIESVERRRAVVFYGIPEFPDLPAAGRDTSDWSAVASILSYLDISGKPTHIFRMGSGPRAGPRNGRLLKVILPSSTIQQLLISRRHQLGSFKGPPGVRVWVRPSLSREERQVSRDKPFTYAPPPSRAFRKRTQPMTYSQTFSQYPAQANDLSSVYSFNNLDVTQPNSPIAPQYGRPPSPSLHTGIQASPANQRFNYFHRF